MQTRRTLLPGQKGTRKYLKRYGKELVCVRYRYDAQQGQRYTTVELIIEQSVWVPTPESHTVGVRVGLHELDLQRQVKQAGGKWNRAKGVWEIAAAQAVKLGLQKRIVKTEVSNSRHKCSRIDTSYY